MIADGREALRDRIAQTRFAWFDETRIVGTAAADAILAAIPGLGVVGPDEIVIRRADTREGVVGSYRDNNGMRVIVAPWPEDAS